MSPPGSTYRLQLGPGFGFREAAALASYLADLGVGHVYLSPPFAARPGSEHGYDVVDPRRLSPELGGEAGFALLEEAVRAAGLGLVLDVVPNHMAIGEHNPFWWDVLEHGPSSPYAAFFDIAWERGGELLPVVAPVLVEPGGRAGGESAGAAAGGGGGPRLLLPVLGEDPSRALRDDAFRVRATPEGFRLIYRDARPFPLEARSWLQVLDAGRPHGRPAAGLRMAAGSGGAGAGSPGAATAAAPAAPLAALREALLALPPFTETEPDRVAVRRSLVEGARASLAEALESDADGIREACAAVGPEGGAGRHRRLRRLLAAQPYALVHWQTADEHVNYRRFFEINELAAVRAERPEVFDETHALVLRLVRDGRVDGLRIDHVDGLWDPWAYLGRLREAASDHDSAPGRSESGASASEGPEPAGATGRAGGRAEAAAPDGSTDPGERPWIVVEKILAPGEELPPEWPVQGTTGYDFLGMVQGLFVHPPGLERLEASWRELTGRRETFAELARDRKRRALREQFGGELAWLVGELERLVARAAGAGTGSGSADAVSGAAAPDAVPPRERLASALLEVSAGLRVYRTYVRDLRPTATDLERLEEALEAAADAGADPDALGWLRRVLRLDGPPEGDAADWLRFVLRWQQLTGPAAAKGVEDTALYVDRRLLALNEVGADPEAVPDPGAVHAFLRRRAGSLPRGLNATTTHDTKRSEDVRARLLVLSDRPDAWRAAVARWREWNAALRGGPPVPSADDELLLYQTLVGAWPLEEDDEPGFVDRLEGYLPKALREAKERSDWRRPDEAYEEGLTAFARRILEPGTRFREDFLAFQERLAPFGAVNSLAQLAVQTAAPGVPDRYRGTEMWDFSLVDPDNRRPVDWALRRRSLRALDRRLRREDRAEVCRALSRRWRDGKVKLFVTAEGLRWRRRRARLLAEGDYLPLEIAGARAEHGFAFARRRGDRWAVAVVPRGLARWPEGCGSNGLLPPPQLWDDTRLLLPPGAPRRWRGVFDGREVEPDGSGRAGSEPPTLALGLCLGAFPVGLFESRR